MRQAIRALGWATKAFWILIIAFLATSLYSAMNLRMGFGQPQVFSLNRFLVATFPLFVNNAGYYDLSELNVTIDIMDYNESLVLTTTTFIPLIRRGSNIETMYNVSISLDDIASRYLTYLFNDTIFNVSMSMMLKFAYVIPFRFLTDTTIPWGAPLYNFSAGQISYYFYNLTHQKAIVPLSFENHSPYFGIDGTMLVEIYNSRSEQMGSGTTSMNVPSHSSYKDQVEVIVDSSRLTESGEVHFYFETSMLSVGPVVMPYG